MRPQKTQDQKEMKAISLNSGRNPMKLISIILFLIYLEYKKQHWGERKAEILNRNFTIRDTYNNYNHINYIYINLYNLKTL